MMNYQNLTWLTNHIQNKIQSFKKTIAINFKLYYNYYVIINNIMTNLFTLATNICRSVQPKPPEIPLERGEYFCL